MIIQRSWLKSAQTVAIIYSFENSYNWYCANCFYKSDNVSLASNAVQFIDC